MNNYVASKAEQQQQQREGRDTKSYDEHCNHEEPDDLESPRLRFTKSTAASFENTA